MLNYKRSIYYIRVYPYVIYISFIMNQAKWDCVAHNHILLWCVCFLFLFISRAGSPTLTCYDFHPTYRRGLIQKVYKTYITSIFDIISSFCISTSNQSQTVTGNVCNTTYIT